MKRARLAAVAMGLVAILAAGTWAAPAKASRTTNWLRAVVEKYFDAWCMQDLEMFMSTFASHVNYYGQSLTRDQVRDQMSGKFNRTETRLITFSRMSYSVSGRRAWVTCTREWITFGSGATSCGAARTRFGLVREGRAWKISSVQDLKQLWTNSDPLKCQNF